MRGSGSRQLAVGNGYVGAQCFAPASRMFNKTVFIFNLIMDKFERIISIRNVGGIRKIDNLIACRDRPPCLSEKRININQEGKMKMKNLRFYWKYFMASFIIFICSFSFVFAEEVPQAVTLETRSLQITEPGRVELGEVTLKVLADGTITAPTDIFFQIPENFPAAWDTSIKNLQLSFDTPSGLINEMVAYPDEKTLKIRVTQNLPPNSKITILNLKINIPEFPAYEEIFAGKFINLGYVELFGLSSDESSLNKICASSGSILLKIPPFYAGDDGWSAGGSPATGVVASYKFCSFESTYSAGYYLAGRGFQAIVYAVDADDNWVSSTDTITIATCLASATGTSASAVFYSDDTYVTAVSTYTLSSGWAYVYVKDDSVETIKLKATDQANEIVYGISETSVEVEPYAYDVTASSFQTVGVGWSETVTLEDIHNNAITDTPPSSVTVTSDGNAYFYPDADYTDTEGASSLAYTLTSGTCTIYIKDSVAENIEIKVDDVYDSLTHDGGGVSSLIAVSISMWQARMNAVYHEASGTASDKLVVRAWLEKNRDVVDYGDFGAATLAIYDGDDVEETLTPDTDKDPDSAGIYWFTWEDTDLEAGRSYFAQLNITHEGSCHISNEGFYLSMSEALSSLLQTTALNIQTLKSVAEAIGSEVTSGVSVELAATKADTAAALAATTTTLPASINTVQQELEPHINARILNTETQVVSGGTMVIRYRIPAGSAVTPVVDVYDPDQVQVVSDAPMTVIGSSDVYEYSLTLDASWGYGFFTILCSETTYNTLDGVTVNVITTDLESIASDISAVLGSTSGLSDLGNVTDILDVQFNEVSNKLSSINDRIVDTIGSSVKGVLQEISDQQADGIYQAMDTVSGTMREMGAATAVGLEDLYGVSRESSNSINYVRNKFIELENLLKINKRMIDDVTYEPIVQTWYEFR